MTTLYSRGQRVLMDIFIEAREKAELSQEQLARRLKKPQSYVAKVENGYQIPDPMECNAWALACGLSLWQFWWRFVMRLTRTV